VAARRRGRGEGSIYRRKDGRWVGEYEVGGKLRYVYSKTRKEVASKLTKAVADGNEGLVFDSNHLTVAQYLDRWLDSIRDTVRENTWVRHEINGFVEGCLERIGEDDPAEEQLFRDLWEDETQREVALDSLKADCEVKMGRPPSF
jgi:hypothetical protein